MRRAQRAVYRALLAPVPFGLKLFVARRLAPNLFRYLPAGREVTQHDYLGRYTVVLDPQYPVEGRMLVSKWEPTTVALIRALVGDGGVCLDVGANVGPLTIAMAECVGPHGRVDALQLGVVDRPGTRYWSPNENGNPANATMQGSTGTPVAVVSVDGFFADRPLPRLDFVKVDVEDMEYEVLVGGVATWVTYRPVIYFESEDRGAVTARTPGLRGWASGALLANRAARR